MGKSFWARLPKAQYGVRRRPSWNRYFFLNLLESLFKAGTDYVSYAKEEFREHFKKVSEERYENVPEDVDRVVDRAPDLREHKKTRGGGRGSGGRRIGRKW